MDKEYIKEIANTILSQMGGAGKIKAMVGATNFIYGTCQYGDYEQPYVYFNFKMNRKLKWCKVIYEQGKDTYVMQFLDKNGKVVNNYDDVYCDDLINLFETTTGLYLTL